MKMAAQEQLLEAGAAGEEELDEVRAVDWRPVFPRRGIMPWASSVRGNDKVEVEVRCKPKSKLSPGV